MKRGLVAELGVLLAVAGARKSRKAIGLRGEVGACRGIGGFTHPFGDGCGVFGFDAAGLEVAGGGECVEGTCGHGGALRGSSAGWLTK